MRLMRMMKLTIKTICYQHLAKVKLLKWIMKKILTISKKSDTLPQRKNEVGKFAQSRLKMSQATKFVWMSLLLLHTVIMKLVVLALSLKWMMRNVMRIIHFTASINLIIIAIIFQESTIIIDTNKRSTFNIQGWKDQAALIMNLGDTKKVIMTTSVMWEKMTKSMSNIWI